MKINRKIVIKYFFTILAVFAVAAVASVVMEHYIFPRLSSSRIFSRIDFFRKAAENVTIINRTEQVTVKEEDSISTVASASVPAVVSVISYGKNQPAAQIMAASKSSTGIIATSDGIIAAYRGGIMEEEADYKILLYDGSVQAAKLTGIDEFTNLAFLKIDATNLTSMPIADSDEVKPGKKLVAIGNAGGEYQNVFSAGIMTSRHKTFNIAGKTVSSSEKLEGVMEADFGNAPEFLGGPVINYQGEMVGLVGSVNMDGRDKYFIIPGNIFKKSLDLATKNELKTRPVLGIYYQTLTQEIFPAGNPLSNQGAIVYSPSGKKGLAILAGSSAEAAGLELYDQIKTINGHEINPDNPLSVLVSQQKKGDIIELTVLRTGKEMKIKVQL